MKKDILNYFHMRKNINKSLNLISIIEVDYYQLEVLERIYYLFIEKELSLKVIN